MTDKIQSRRQRIREAAYEEIHAVAWQQVGEFGAASLSLRAIARAMGMTAPGLYRYYEDRDALVTALIIDAFSSFSAALEAARDACSPDDHAGRFRAISLAYRQWAVAHPQRYVLIFGTPIPGYEMPEEAGPAAQRSFLVLAGVIHAAYEAGELRPTADLRPLTPSLLARYEFLRQIGLPVPPIVTHLALASWSWIHGLTSLELYGYLPSFLGDQAGEFIHLEVEAFMRTLGLEPAVNGDPS